jgi:hypothetical protein
MYLELGAVAAQCRPALRSPSSPVGPGGGWTGDLLFRQLGRVGRLELRTPSVHVRLGDNERLVRCADPAVLNALDLRGPIDWQVDDAGRRAD